MPNKPIWFSTIWAVPAQIASDSWRDKHESCQGMGDDDFDDDGDWQGRAGGRTKTLEGYRIQHHPQKIMLRSQEL